MQHHSWVKERVLGVACLFVGVFVCKDHLEKPPIALDTSFCFRNLNPEPRLLDLEAGSVS